MGIILAIILAVSAGVSFGAEQSLPGDALYPIKTGVNETVQGWFALSAEAEAEHQANLAIRRLGEAEELKADGRLDAEIKSELEAEFREHAKATDDSSLARTKIKSSISTKGGILGITEIEIENVFDSEDDGEIDNNSQSSVESNIVSKISSDFGDLKLEYNSGAVKLSGRLSRANPCVDWRVETIMTKDMPSSNATFNIAKHSTAEVCIQVLGEPQEIELKVPNVGENANITVKVEGKIVHSAKLR